MPNKKLILFAIFLVSLLAVGTVSAADNLTGDVHNSANHMIDENSLDFQQDDSNSDKLGMEFNDSEGVVEDISDTIFQEDDNDDIGSEVKNYPKDEKQLRAVKSFKIGNASKGIDDVTYSIKATDDDGYDDFTSNILKSEDGGKEVPEMSVDIDVENSTITVGLPEDATGNVTVKINGIFYDVTEVIDGSAVFAITDVLSSNHTVEVIYSGDDTYDSASDSIGMEVPKDANYSIAVSSADITEGQTEVIGIELSIDVDGIVLVAIGDKGYYADIVGGKAVLYVDNLVNGTYTALVTYPGDVKYDVKSNSTFFVVKAKVNSSNVIDIGINVPDNCTNGTIVVELPEDATGNVTVLIDGRVYNVIDMINGTSVIAITDILPGNHTVGLIYSGDSNYTGVFASEEITVPKVSDYMIDISGFDIVEGQTETLTIKMSVKANGIAVVNVGGVTYAVTIKNGKGTLKLDNLTAKSYTSKVTYLEDNIYMSKSNSTKFKVLAKENPEMSVDIDVENGIATVELNDNATGNVTVVIDGKVYNVTNITESPVTIGIGKLKTGNHAVEIIYSGDDYFTSDSNVTIVEVPKIDDYEISVVALVDYSSVDITVRLPEDVIGPVLIDVDGVGYYANATDGQAKLHLDDLYDGEHDVVVTYLGDEKYALRSNSTTFEVSKVSDYSIVITANDIDFGDNVDIAVKLPEDIDGVLLLDIDGVGYYVNLTNGAAKFDLPINLNAGLYNVTATYQGDDKYASLANVSSFRVNKLATALNATEVTTVYNINENLIITLKDGNGNPLTGVNVTVKLEGTKNYTTDINGQVKVATGSLTPKTYSAQITFPGSENYVASNATAKVTVKKAASKITASAKTFKTITKTKKYTITLKNNKGKAIKNVKVYLRVNGVTYSATTNSKGQATFKITKLTKKGKYNAVITYKESKYYKKATKKVKLTVKPAWKTVSIGSSDHSAVKKIQKALKKKGYYITYHGSRLKTDGVFESCTQKAVMKFQKNNGLKATGKVDEKTAIKLKLI